jgi:hypothetical protein
MTRASRSSLSPGLQVNGDGSVDISGPEKSLFEKKTWAVRTNHSADPERAAFYLPRMRRRRANMPIELGHVEALLRYPQAIFLHAAPPARQQ